MVSKPSIFSRSCSCLTDLRVSSLTAGWGDTEHGDLGLCRPHPRFS